MRHAKTLTLVLSTLVPLVALAHGNSPPLMGVVKASDAQGLTVETQDHQDVKVAFDANTKFEQGAAPATAQAVQAGERVVVHTSKRKAGLVAILVKLPAAKAEAAAPNSQKVAIAVTDQGFTPDQVKVKKDQPVELVITRKTDDTCATAISIPELNIRKDLPLNQPVTIDFTPKQSGQIKYACGMGMAGGVIAVE